MKRTILLKLDKISNIIQKFGNHPSILRIKESKATLNFPTVSEPAR